MFMARNPVEEVGHLAAEALHWVATEYKYLKDVREHVDKLEAEDVHRQISDVKAARRAFRYVGRSERSANRISIKLMRRIDEVLEISPPRERAELIGIRSRMLVPINDLKAHFSLYTGDVRKQIDNLALSVELEKVKSYDKGQMMTLKAEINAMKQTLWNVAKWLIALDAELKILERFIAKLQVPV